MLGSRVERALPERVAEHDDGRFARQSSSGKQQPTVEGLRAEQVEEARRRQQHLDPLRLGERRFSAAADQRPAATLRDRQLGERSILVLDVDELARRRPVLRDVDARRPEPQHGQSVGIRIWERLEQERVDDAEDRRVRSDSDRERRDDHRRSGRRVRLNVRSAYRMSCRKSVMVCSVSGSTPSHNLRKIAHAG